MFITDMTCFPSMSIYFLVRCRLVGCILSVLMLASGCNPPSSTKAKPAAPAKVEMVPHESDLATITLTPEAEERLGIVVLSNGDLGYELLPQSLALRIADLHIGAPVRDWSTELFGTMAADLRRNAEAEARTVAGRVLGTHPSRPLDAFAGRYRSDVLGEAIVTVSGGCLRFRIVEGAAGELEHWHYDEFRLYLNASNPGGFFTSFDTDPAGRVSAMNVTGLGVFQRAASR